VSALSIVAMICLIFYLLFEPARMNFGYKGNINESFPELIAFLIQTILFSFAFTLMPFIHSFKMPHEDCMYIINILFLIVEILIGFWVMFTFSSTQGAAFYRRTAPLIDKNFKKKYLAVNQEGTGNPKRDLRDIQIGMKKEGKGAQGNAFEESDLTLKMQNN
jgi:hypothetical protein